LAGVSVTTVWVLSAGGCGLTGNPELRETTPGRMVALKVSNGAALAGDASSAFW
jgi:hypothetical protein